MLDNSIHPTMTRVSILFTEHYCGREKENKIIIPAFEDKDIISGQGTVGLEIMEDLENVDEVYVPVGGGWFDCGDISGDKIDQPEGKNNWR